MAADLFSAGGYCRPQASALMTAIAERATARQHRMFHQKVFPDSLRQGAVPDLP
jgi:hypothetical protein